MLHLYDPSTLVSDCRLPELQVSPETIPVTAIADRIAMWSGVKLVNFMCECALVVMLRNRMGTLQNLRPTPSHPIPRCGCGRSGFRISPLQPYRKSRF